MFLYNIHRWLFILYPYTFQNYMSSTFSSQSKDGCLKTRGFQAPKRSAMTTYIKTTATVRNYKLLMFSFAGNFLANKFF